MTVTTKHNNRRMISAKILEIHQPFTLSCVYTVEVMDELEGLDGTNNIAVLKLYDRRFAAELRKEWLIDPWTEETESTFRDMVATGAAAEFVRKLRGDDYFEVSTNGTEGTG